MQSNVVAPDFRFIRAQLEAARVPAEPPRLLRTRPCRAHEIDVAGIARRLGMADRRARTIIARIRLLAACSGFPLPKTPRFVAGVRQQGPAAIDAFSIWDRDPVELWFEDDRPPAEAAANAAARRTATRHDLAMRARALVA